MALGCPGSSSSLRGVKAVSTWDLPGSCGQNHGIFGPVPQAQAHRECLGTSPTCPETLRPLLQGCHGRAGTLAGPGPAVVRRPVQGAGSSWGCGKVGLWIPVATSSLASVVVLHTYPHPFSPLLSGHRLASHSRGQPDSLHWRFTEPPAHQTRGAWTPLSYHVWGVQAHLASQTREPRGSER